MRKLMIIGSLALCALLVPTDALAQSHSPALQVLSLTNRIRMRHDLSPLRLNANLQRAALGHARDLERARYFSHTDRFGRSPEERAIAAGYTHIDWEHCQCYNVRHAIGENIATGPKTPRQVVSRWLASPLHRSNLLSTEFNEIGIAVVDDTWVQVFGVVETW